MKKTTSSKITKNTIINIRIPKVEKEQYVNEAKKYGMNLSELVLNSLRCRKLNIIKDGGEIAKAMYELNNTLNNCKNLNVSVENIRKSISNCVGKMNNFLCEIGEENVNTKI